MTVEYITTEGGPTMTQAVIAGEAQMSTQSDATTVTLMASNPKPPHQTSPPCWNAATSA